MDEMRVDYSIQGDKYVFAVPLQYDIHDRGAKRVVLAYDDGDFPPIEHLAPSVLSMLTGHSLQWFAEEGVDVKFQLMPDKQVTWSCQVND